MKLSLALSTIVALSLGAAAAHAAPVCIQDDTTGNALVLLKASFKRGKAGPASGYMAVYTPGGFLARTITATTVTSTGGYVGIGVTEHPVTISTFGAGLSSLTVFHQIACAPGDDGKLSLLDDCTDAVRTLGGSPEVRDMHVVDCVDDYRIP